MKKSLPILVTGAMFVAGAMTASADRYYQRGDAPVVEIQAGVQYALNCGKPDHAGEKAFLNGTSFLFGTENITATCLYTFEVAGTNSKNETVYYLKNSAGEYFTAPGRSQLYTTNKDNAWKVTVKPVYSEYYEDYEYSTEDEDLVGIDAYRQEFRESDEALDLSNVSYFGDLSEGVVIAGAEPDDPSDICSTYTYLLGVANGASTGNVSRGTNYKNNVWAIYEVEQQSAETYLEAVIFELFGDTEDGGWNPEDYTTGNTPGDYSQEAIDKVTEAYENALGATEETAEELAEALKKAYEEFEASFVSFKPGYYVFCSARDTNGGAMYDNTGNVDGDTGSSYASRTVNGLKWCYSSSHPGDNANHSFVYDASLEGDEWCAQAGLKYMVWEVIGTDIKNRYYFRNWATGNYIHVIKTNNTQVPVVKEPTEEDLYTMEPNTAYTYEDADGQTRPLWMFYNDNNWVNPNTHEVSGIHTAGDYANTVAWGKSTEGSSWTIRTVTNEELERITELGRQPELNANLKSLVTEAEQFVESTKSVAFYNGDVKVTSVTDMSVVDGLVTRADQISSNASDEEEGKDLGALVDGKPATLWHSNWHAGGDVDGEYHNLVLNLEKECENVTIKFASRNGNINGVPYMFNVYGSNDGENWEEVSIISEEEVETGEVDENEEPIFETQYTGGAKVQWMLDKRAIGAGGQTNAIVGYLNTKLGYSYIRLDNVHAGGAWVQEGNNYRDATGNGAMPYFNISEIRVYEGVLTVAEDLESIYYVVPVEVRDELEKQLAAAAEELEDEMATQETIDALQKALDAFKEATPNPQSLRDLITAATGIHDSAEAGDEPGYFSQDAIDALQKAIDEAEGKYKGSMTVIEVADAKAALQAALDAFQDALIKPADGIYVITSKTSNENSFGGRLYSQHSSTVDAVNHGYTGSAAALAESVLGSYWQVEKVQDGFTFKNLYTGLYLAPVGKDSEAMSQSEAPYVFVLQFAQEPGCFNFVLDKKDAKNETYIYMNAQPGTGNVVTWTSAQGRDNSAWAFEAVDAEALDEVIDEGFNYNLEIAAKPQVATFPVDLDPSLAEEVVEFYTIIGQDANNDIQLAKAETVVAGQAYILIPSAEGKDIRLYTDATKVEELEPTHELADPVNGLVPVFNSMIVPEKCGIFMADHSKVTYSEGTNDDKVRANSGYFNEMPFTTEKGAAFIPSAGKFADGIQNIIMNSDVEKGIYSISGVRVNSMKNLPAGLYIINGKKYIVK